MAIRALTGIAAEWFTPPSQEGEDSPARFKLQPMNGEQFNMVLPDVLITEESAKINGDGVRQILAYGLIDWEGVEGSEGSALSCNRQNHKFLPGFVRLEIASEIFRRSIVSEDERKN